MVRKLLPLGIFIVLLVFLGIGLTLDPSRIPSPLIDKPVPAFTLRQLHDQDLTLTTDDLGDRVTLLNVWASWCAGCREEHPLLLELARSGVVDIFGLNYKDRREDALAWLQRHGDPYGVIGHDLDGKVGIDFGVYGAPETFIIDGEGIVRYKHIGPLTPDIVDRDILPFIRELRVAGR